MTTCEIVSVAVDQYALEFSPSENEDSVLSFGCYDDKNTNQIWYRRRKHLLEDLLFPLQSDVVKSLNVKLPGTTVYGLDLDQESLSPRVRCNDVIFRNVAGESRSDESSSTEFSPHQVLAYLLRQLIVSPCRHSLPFDMDKATSRKCTDVWASRRCELLLSH